MKNDPTTPAIGIIGGSGIYQMEALTEVREIELDTPFGPPSDVIFAGRLAGRDVYFLPRHARGHRLLPTEIPTARTSTRSGPSGCAGC